MDQFLAPETDIKHQFLDPETDKKCQFLDGHPETDVMDQFLDPETDIMGEGNYIDYILWIEFCRLKIAFYKLKI